ncbi:MAG: hypothetical protein C0404_14690, partial [Verrucomicrobia bacterium]|nr:hypothetical protein [Verrucomicrobiota bacterium]
GDRKGVLIGLFDGSTPKVPANGCFNDYCVDRMRVDLNGDGKLDEKTEDFLMSRVLSFADGLWDIATDSGCSNFTMAPGSRPAGTLALNCNLKDKTAAGAIVADLVSDAGYAIRYDSSRSPSITAPAGMYRMLNGRITAADSNGSIWAAAFALPDTFEIKAGAGASLKMGSPLKLEPHPHDRLRLGIKACISPTITGIAGETYDNIAPKDTRMTPFTTISDLEGIVVSEGRMDYG